MNTLPRLTPPALLVAALLLHGCGDEPAEQIGEPIDMPATTEQIEMLDQVVERFPELSPLADQARADGTVTEQEIISVFTAAEKAKTARDGE